MSLSVDYHFAVFASNWTEYVEMVDIAVYESETLSGSACCSYCVSV